MNVIGIRTSPTQINYAIVQNTDESYELKIIDKIVLPKSMDLPEVLKYARNTILDICREFNVKKACIRITEPVAKGTSVNRLRIEGVLLESIASCDVEDYYVATISTMAPKLDTDSKTLKLFMTGEEVFREIPSWKADYDVYQRESILAAISTNAI